MGWDGMGLGGVGLVAGVDCFGEVGSGRFGWVARWVGQMVWMFGVSGG